MQIVLDVQNQKDLWDLLQFVRSLREVKIMVAPKNQENQGEPIPNSKPGKKLDDFMGAAQNSDVQNWEMQNESLEVHGQHQIDLNEEQENPTACVADFWGSNPSLDTKAFDKYLEETRQEWERPIS